MLRIRYWRLQRGKSQSWLSEKIGRSVQVVSKWERGEIIPPSSMIPLLADALEITPGDLFPSKDSDAPETITLAH